MLSSITDNEELMQSLKALFTIPHVSGLVIWIVLFVWQTKLVKQGKLCNRGLKRIEAAQKAGRVVEAHFESFWFSKGTGNTRYHRTYVYEVDGIKYKKIHTTGNVRHKEVITLYYNRSPKRAKTYAEMRGVLPDVWPLLSSLVAGGLAMLLLQKLGL